MAFVCLSCDRNMNDAKYFINEIENIFSRDPIR